MILQTILSAALIFAVLPGTQHRLVQEGAFQAQDDEVITGISIKNPYNVPIYFRVRHANGTFIDRQLAAGTEKTYYHYNHIWIYSENGSVNYRLEKEGRYVFYWDIHNERWDLRRRR